MADGRRAVEAAEASLRGSGRRSSFASEQKLDPVRERIGELRLKEQEARLNEESLAHQLEETGADEAALAGRLEKGDALGALNGEIARLDGEIAAPGAVERLAAVERACNAATEAEELPRCPVRRPDRSDGHAGIGDSAASIGRRGNGCLPPSSR